MIPQPDAVTKVHHDMKSFWCSVLLLMVGFCCVSQSAMAEWWGHLATLEAAKTSCRDIDSKECLPYLAEAVAVADTLNNQAKIATTNGQTEVDLFGDNGSVWRCNLASYNSLNGQSLMYMALGEDYGANAYWTDALRHAALRSCKMR